MILRRRQLRAIQAAGRDVDLVRKVVVLESQRRAAMRTEAARCLRGRLEASRLARDKSKLGPRHAKPCDERGAGGSPADRAMTVGLIERAFPPFRNGSARKNNRLSAFKLSFEHLFLYLRHSFQGSQQRIVGDVTHRNRLATLRPHITAIEKSLELIFGPNHVRQHHADQIVVGFLGDRLCN